MKRDERPIQTPTELSHEDLDEEMATELPDREAMSIVYPDPSTSMVPHVEQAAAGTPPGEPVYTIQPVDEEPI